MMGGCEVVWSFFRVEGRNQADDKLVALTGKSAWAENE